MWFTGLHQTVRELHPVVVKSFQIDTNSQLTFAFELSYLFLLTRCYFLPQIVLIVIVIILTVFKLIF